MRILKTDQLAQQNIIQQVCQVLAEGGLVIFPTETTYGAGVDATNQAAVDKLLAYKSRREGKPLSIAVTDQKMAEQYVDVNDSAARLYQRFLPGPVTVVSRSKGTVAQGVASEYGTLGVRIPAYSLIVEIVKAYGKPITATSANGSGEKRPYTIQDIFDGLSEKQKGLIDLVLDAGQLPSNPPSTVIDTTLDTPVVFRQGEVQLEKNSSTESTTFSSHSEAETQEIAQRILLKHWNTIKTQGLVVGLHGSLGAGKTIFVKGMAKFLGIQETLTSPTYTYLLQYEYNRHGQAGQLYHLDLWRLEKAELLEDLRISQLVGPNQVVAIEWPSIAEQELHQIFQQTNTPYLELHVQESSTTPSDRQIVLHEPNQKTVA